MKDIIKLFSRERRKFYFFISKVAGYYPLRVSIFKQAFVHKSSVQEYRNHLDGHNERLEFLGDAVLGACVAQILFELHPEWDEGIMTKVRSDLVSRKQLNRLALSLGMDEFISYSAPHQLANTHIPGDVLEAFIAAIYLDGGIKRAYNFAKRHIANKQCIKETLAVIKTGNYKSLLLEWGQRHKHEVTFVTHPIWDGSLYLVFHSTALVDGQNIGEGKGKSKKKAEQKAAHAAISFLREYEQLS